MTAITHMMGGSLAGQLLVIAAGTGHPLLLVGASVVGSLVPDIDHHNSKISRSSVAAKVTSYVVSGVTHHRGFIHTPAFVIITALVMCGTTFFVDGIGYYLALGILVGMLSHLLLDTLNPSGIMWLWPITKKRFHLFGITTRSLGEWLVTAALVIVNVMLATPTLSAVGSELRGLFSGL